METIIRTFHPIGQGAFYSERFYDGDENVMNIVFDCGVDGVNEQNESVVRQAFNQGDIIDYLFVSHLDNDHISLVNTLMKSVASIKEVVLPYITKDNARSLAGISNADSSPFLNLLLRAFDNELGEADPHFILIQSEDEEVTPPIENRCLYSRRGGDPLRNRFNDWVFIPYNKHMERGEELRDQLKKLVNDTSFTNELSRIGHRVTSVDDLIEKLTSQSFADLIDRKTLRKKLQQAYKAISGTINQNSLLLYSGPDNDSVKYRFEFEYCLRDHFLCERPFWNRTACLYTGDGDFAMGEYKTDLASRWECVGTIQLPHHGSYQSFKLKENQYSFDSIYVFPVSCGENNHFGHPSGKVLSFLLTHRCFPMIVTECQSTIYMQHIRCWRC